MIYGYSIYRAVSLELAALFSTPIRGQLSILQQTLHPDPDNCSNIYFLFDACDNPWRSVESTVAQHYHYTDQH